MVKIHIAVLGMGYVGLTSAVSFARHGFETIVVEPIKEKVEMLNRGKVPFYEPGLDVLVREEVEAGRLKATQDTCEAVLTSHLSFICVGTPSLPDGSADLSQVKQASSEIGKALKDLNKYHVVVVKSTVPPGTTEEVVIPILEKNSGKKAGRDFGVVMNPEFLREGQAVHDSQHPDRIVIGELDKRAGELLQSIYKGYKKEDGSAVPILRVGIKASELIKYASNSFLATKISFANEFARICEKFEVDVYEVMKGVGLDFRINPRFLNAGAGFGGSCFPKDVSAMVTMANKLGVKTPLLKAVLETNEIQPRHCVQLVKEALGELTGKVVAFLGLAFKAGTDDVRHTRALPMIEALCQLGATVRAYDPKATANFKYLTTSLSVKYVNSVEEALEGADCAVVQTDWEEFKKISSDTFKRLLKKPIVVDCRRTYEPKKMIEKGIIYIGVGCVPSKENVFKLALHPHYEKNDTKNNSAEPGFS